MDKSSYLTLIPEQVLLHIAYFLPFRDVINLSMTCKPIKRVLPRFQLDVQKRFQLDVQKINGVGMNEKNLKVFGFDLIPLNSSKNWKFICVQKLILYVKYNEQSQYPGTGQIYPRIEEISLQLMRPCDHDPFEYEYVELFTDTFSRRLENWDVSPESPIEDLRMLTYNENIMKNARNGDYVQIMLNEGGLIDFIVEVHIVESQLQSVMYS